MAIVMKGQKPDRSYAHLQLDDNEKLQVTTRTESFDVDGIGSELVLAGASSRSGLIGTVANAEYIYVRADADGYRSVDWRIKGDQKHDVYFYKSRDAVDSVTITLGTAALDNGDTAVVNGKTFTAHTNTTVAATGQYAIDGDTAADCIELAKVLAPGKAITLASVVANDTVTVNNVTFTGHATTTTPASRQFDIAPDATAAAGLVLCINHKDNMTLSGVDVGDTVTISDGTITRTYTAAASADVDAGVFDQSGTDSQCGDSLVLCINHKDTITTASAIAGDQVTINGLTFEGKASTAIYPERKFSIDTGDPETGISLAAAINDTVWGVPGVTATATATGVTLAPDTPGQTITMTAGTGGTNSHTRIVCTAANGIPGLTAANASGVVSLTRNYEDTLVSMSASDTSIVCATAKGVPGVLAAATDGGEVIVTPVWKGETITVTSSDDTIKYVDYGLRGCSVAYTATTVVVTPDMDSAEPCTCIYAVIVGADADEFTVTNGTKASLLNDDTAVADVAANSTTIGTTYVQNADGYPYLYVGVMNDSGSTAANFVVGATQRK